MLSPDCFLYKHCYAEFYVGKIPRIRIGGPPLQRGVVLKWFYSLSRRNTFVGGTCALPSALLVLLCIRPARLTGGSILGLSVRPSVASVAKIYYCENEPILMQIGETRTLKRSILDKEVTGHGHTRLK